MHFLGHKQEKFFYATATLRVFWPTVKKADPPSQKWQIRLGILSSLFLKNAYLLSWVKIEFKTVVIWLLLGQFFKIFAFSKRSSWGIFPSDEHRKNYFWKISLWLIHPIKHTCLHGITIGEYSAKKFYFSHSRQKIVKKFLHIFHFKKWKFVTFLSR